MWRTSICRITTVVAIAVMTANNALAQQANYASAAVTDSISLHEQLTSMRAELTELRAQVQSYSTANGPIQASFDDCCPCDDSCCSTRYYGGGAAMFLKPFFGDNTAYVFEDATGVNTFQPFDYDYEAAWRVWAGFEQCSGIGLRGSYFHFDHSAARAEVAPEDGFTRAIDPEYEFLFGEFNAGDEIAANHSLKIYWIDAEVTYTFQCGGCCELLSSLGVRYGSLEQDYSFTNITDPDESRSTSYRFKGYGPTASFGLNCPVGGCLFVFSTVRGTVMWGDSDWQGGDVDRADDDFIIDNNKGVLGIGEVSVGTEWRSCNYFIRAALEGQAYAGQISFTHSDELLVLGGFTVGGGMIY